MHIFRSQGIKSCSSCSCYLITAAQILSLIYLLLVRLLPLLPSCLSSLCTELAVVLRPAWHVSSFPLSKGCAPGYFCIKFFICWPCFGTKAMLRGIAVYGCYFKAAAFPRMFLFWTQTSSLYACCQVALVGRVCLPLPCASLGLCPPRHAARRCAAPMGIWLWNMQGMFTWSLFLVLMQYWSQGPAVWFERDSSCLLLGCGSVAGLQSTALRAHGSS